MLTVNSSNSLFKRKTSFNSFSHHGKKVEINKLHTLCFSLKLMANGAELINNVPINHCTPESNKVQKKYNPFPFSSTLNSLSFTILFLPFSKFLIKTFLHIFLFSQCKKTYQVKRQ